MAAELETKERALRARLRALQRVVVAFSGGVDSAFLATFAHHTLGDKALAVTALSPALARRERDDVLAVAGRIGFRHEFVSTAELQHAEYTRNESDRCYWCKTELFEVLAPVARRERAIITVGTNADDLGDYRPGLRAASEHDVAAPLVDAGLTKSDVRALSAGFGLPTADKPASPCLASRLAYGIEVTSERLRRVDDAEEFLRSLGFEVLRVRDHGDLARVEVPSADIPRASAAKDEISEGLRRLGWRYVTLDLRGFRSGSLNEVLPLPRRRPS